MLEMFSFFPHGDSCWLEFESDRSAIQHARFDVAVQPTVKPFRYPQKEFSGLSDESKRECGLRYQLSFRQNQK